MQLMFPREPEDKALSNRRQRHQERQPNQATIASHRIDEKVTNYVID